MAPRPGRRRAYQAHASVLLIATRAASRPRRGSCGCRGALPVFTPEPSTSCSGTSMLCCHSTHSPIRQHRESDERFRPGILGRTRSRSGFTDGRLWGKGRDEAAWSAHMEHVCDASLPVDNAPPQQLVQRLLVCKTWATRPASYVPGRDLGQASVAVLAWSSSSGPVLSLLLSRAGSPPPTLPGVRHRSWLSCTPLIWSDLVRFPVVPATPVGDRLLWHGSGTRRAV